ncbi:MAG: plasmid pRiA4b ORF-3 family protein [Caldisericia bacterium]|nr:plasmid pRiA4b ORF-3 family protein [Caldisericia bacterium]MDD4615111.1 plasmid pRiA4b ORF-3 family protein [Caldisericia bacterium]
MKAYIVKIELNESNPLIWRRVIFPADATFKRLHDIIQNVTNFQSGYSSDPYHLYDFDLRQEPLMVTNDEIAYQEHKDYIEYKKKMKKTKKALPKEMPQFQKNQIALLEIPTYLPSNRKVDVYLEKYKTIPYTYDFGDNWEFTVTLEDIVFDYYFGYPTLLDGENTAPPEDVGGIFMFYEFLDAYNDPKHPDHEEYKEWADSNHFQEYDPKRINRSLEGVHYKKTEWDKIHHENYKVITDKYRDPSCM